MASSEALRNFFENCMADQNAKMQREVFVYIFQSIKFSRSEMPFRLMSPQEELKASECCHSCDFPRYLHGWNKGGVDLVRLHHHK